MFLKRRPKNEDLRPKNPGLKRRPFRLKRRPSFLISVICYGDLGVCGIPSALCYCDNEVYHSPFLRKVSLIIFRVLNHFGSICSDDDVSAASDKNSSHNPFELRGLVVTSSVAHGESVPRSNLGMANRRIFFLLFFILFFTTAVSLKQLFEP